MIFAIKSTRALGDTCVEPFKVISASEYHEPIVGFQAVNFIKEKALDTVCDQAVQVLEYEETRRRLSSLDEDLSDGVLWTMTMNEISFA